MRKTVALGMAMTMAFTLTACGNKGTAGASAPSSSQASQETTAAAGAEKKETPAPSGEVIKLRYADTCANINPDGWGNAKFIELVNERTNGQVLIEYFDRCSLGSDKEITQSCLDGTLDMCKCTSGNLTEFSDGLAIFDLPGLFRDFEHARTVVEDPEMRQYFIDDIYKETGLYAMIFEFDEPRGLGTTGKEIRTPDQAKGLKLRTTGAPIEMALFNQWGVSSIAQSMTEVYTSLQNGVIDGAYNQAYILNQESCSEVIDNWVQFYQSWCLSVKFMGPTAIEKLGGVDSELFKTVLDCAREVEEWQAEQWLDFVAESHKDMAEKYNVNVVKLTDEELEVWFDESHAIWDQYVGEGKQFSQDLVDKIQKLAKE